MDSNSAQHPSAGTPGSENTPGGGGSTDGADRAAPGAPPAASNQPKAEDFQTAPDVTGGPGTLGSADPQSPSAGGTLAPAASSGGGGGGSGGGGIGDDDRVERTGGFASYSAPDGALADDDSTGAARTASGSPPDSVQSVPAPGDSAGVNVPSRRSAAGTSQDSDQVTGVRATSIAPPGKPDGEVDTSR